MPLNSSHLHHSIVDIIREIPTDREDAPDYPYQTKVDMYDNRCSGCGFCRVEVYPSDVYNVEPIIFNNSKEAVVCARKHGYRINRTCEYPADVQTRSDGKAIYPTLTEIISNTCDLWDIEKISSLIPPDDSHIIELINLLKINAEE